ncbi:MAG: stalk domain-containing protein [Caldisericia bacterium]
MLPMRFVAEYLGADEIIWDGETRTVDLEFTDYRCLNRKQKIFGRIEEVSDLGDGTSMVIFTCQDGSVKRFVSENNLSGNDSTNVINDYLGYAELEYIDDWVFS